VRTRQAYDLGVTRGELAGPGWDAPYRGMRRPAGAPEPRSPLQRIYDAAELLPAGGAIGGWAAAYLRRATELDGRGWSGADIEPVPFVLPPPIIVRKRDGIVFWRSQLTDDDVCEVDGVCVTVDARTGFDLVRTRDLRGGVISLDVMGRQAGLSPADVLTYARRHRRWRGVPRVAPAVELADPRARSTGETRFRLVWVLDAGLPAPEVNPSLFDDSGFLLGEPDLLDIEAGLVGEYDGAGHRELETHALDNAREEWIEDCGLVVVRSASPDMWESNRARTVRRLTVARRRGLARDRGRDRWSYVSRPMPVWARAS